MLRIKRGNVLLDIKEDELDYYLSVGYALIDEKGNIIKKSNIVSIPELEALCKEANDKVAKLEAENEKLKAEISKLKKANKTSK